MLKFLGYLQLSCEFAEILKLSIHFFAGILILQVWMEFTICGILKLSNFCIARISNLQFLNGVYNFAGILKLSNYFFAGIMNLLFQMEFKLCWNLKFAEILKLSIHFFAGILNLQMEFKLCWNFES